jgi:transcriptional regulator with XRE-family HTH domain
MNKIKPAPDNILESILSEINPELEERVEFRMRLAEKIDKARIKKGLSKKQLAEKLSKRPSEISKWLSGTHNFTSDTLYEIQHLLDIVLIDVEDNRNEQVWYFTTEVIQSGLEISNYPYLPRLDDALNLYNKTYQLYSSNPRLYFNKIEANA